MQIQESEYFTQEFSLDIKLLKTSLRTVSSRTVAQNCHGRSINLAAKRKTSRQKEKDSKQKENHTAKRKRLAAKRETSRGKKDSKQKENLTAKRKRLTAKFLRYREDILILISFAMRSWLFFLPWGFSFCCEVNSFSVIVVGHRTFEILFPKIQHVGICEN